MTDTEVIVTFPRSGQIKVHRGNCGTVTRCLAPTSTGRMISFRSMPADEVPSYWHECQACQKAAPTCAGPTTRPYQHACTCGGDLGRCYLHSPAFLKAYAEWHQARAAHEGVLLRFSSFSTDELDALEQQAHDRRGDAAQEALVCIDCGRPTNGTAYCEQVGR